MGNRGGGDGPAGGGSGTVRDARKASRKNEGRKLAKLLTPTPIKVIQAIGKGIENTKKERAADVNLGTADYQGSPTGRKSRVRTRQVGGGDNDGPSQKSVEQPKVASQMNAPKSELAATAGPTDVEMAAVPEVADLELSEDERLRRIKRKGRKSTILAGQRLDDKVQLSKPSLLG